MEEIRGCYRDDLRICVGTTAAGVVNKCGLILEVSCLVRALIDIFTLIPFVLTQCLVKIQHGRVSAINVCSSFFVRLASLLPSAYQPGSTMTSCPQRSGKAEASSYKISRNKAKSSQLDCPFQCNDSECGWVDRKGCTLSTFSSEMALIALGSDNHGCHLNTHTF
jgi:hypothetical protein